MASGRSGEFASRDGVARNRRCQMVRNNTDIEGRKRAEEALRSSEGNLDAIVNTIPTAAWTTRPDGYCDFLNRVWLDYAGMTMEEAQGWGWAESIHPEDRKKLVEGWQSCLASGTPVDTEARIRRFDGSYRWFLIRGNPLKDEGGKILKWYGTCVDIEDRKRAEQALREQASLLSLTHDAILVCDLNGILKYWNSGARELYGWTAEEAIGKLTHGLLKTVFSTSLKEITAEVMSKGRWEGELVQTKKDGMQIVTASRWALQRDEGGSPVGVLETNNDITKGKRAEEALKRSESYLAQAQRLSHTGSWQWNVRSGEVSWSREY